MRRVTRDLLTLGLTCALLFPLWCGAGPAGSTHADSPTTKKTYQFVNGRWFDGRKFRHRTFYSVDGLLTGWRPRTVDEVIDLHGGYVVPPFGDAHNHYLASPYNAEAVIREYLKDGIFYVENPTNIARDTNSLRGLGTAPAFRFRVKLVPRSGRPGPPPASPSGGVKGFSAFARWHANSYRLVRCARRTAQAAALW